MRDTYGLRSAVRPIAFALTCFGFAGAVQAQAAPPAEPSAAPTTTTTEPAQPNASEATPPSAAEPSAPAPVLAPPPPPPLAAPESAPALEPPPPPPAPSKIAVGTDGFFKPGVNLQGWFQFSDRYDSAYSFRLRRAEISAKGDIIPGLVSYAVMFDPARVLEPANKNFMVGDQTLAISQPNSPLSALQDFFVTYTSDYIDASIGQFKIPVSYEGYGSASKLLFPERSVVARAFGDRRDLGLRLAKSFKYFGYSAGIFNGSGQNTLDNDHAKDGALRVEAYPIEGLTIALVGYTTLYDRKKSAVRDRYEADLRFEKNGFLFQGEIIGGAVGAANNAPRTKSFGMYGALAYRLPFNLEPAFRIGYYDPNTKIDVKATDKGTNDETVEINAGLNYYVKNHEAKLQLAYTYLKYQTLKDDTQVVFNAQVAY